MAYYTRTAWNSPDSPRGVHSAAGREGLLGAWGVLVPGQSSSQRDLFKLEDAPSLPPPLCEQELLVIGVVWTTWKFSGEKLVTCMGSVDQELETVPRVQLVSVSVGRLEVWGLDDLSGHWLGSLTVGVGCRLGASVLSLWASWASSRCGGWVGP